MKTVEELTTLSSDQLLTKLDELREAAREAGYRWAEAENKYKSISELMPSILAEFIASELAESGITHNAARSKALANKLYQEQVKRMVAAEYEARLAEVEYKGLMKSIDALTSIAYVRNSEIKLSR